MDHAPLATRTQDLVAPFSWIPRELDSKIFHQVPISSLAALEATHSSLKGRLLPHPPRWEPWKLKFLYAQMRESLLGSYGDETVERVLAKAYRKRLLNTSLHQFSTISPSDVFKGFSEVESSASDCDDTCDPSEPLSKPPYGMSSSIYASSADWAVGLKSLGFSEGQVNEMLAMSFLFVTPEEKGARPLVKLLPSVRCGLTLHAWERANRGLGRWDHSERTSKVTGWLHLMEEALDRGRGSKSLDARFRADELMLVTADQARHILEATATRLSKPTRLYLVRLSTSNPGCIILEVRTRKGEFRSFQVPLEAMDEVTRKLRHRKESHAKSRYRS